MELAEPGRDLLFILRRKHALSDESESPSGSQSPPSSNASPVSSPSVFSAAKITRSYFVCEEVDDPGFSVEELLPDSSRLEDDLLSLLEEKREQYYALKQELDRIEGRDPSPPPKKLRLEDEDLNGSGENQADEDWLAMFEQLRAYKETFGDTIVPSRWQKNNALSNWVRDHRALKKRGILRPDREAMLNSIEFQWILKPGTVQWAGLWDKRYDELKTFKEKYGDVNVPTRYKHNPTLSVWVRTQRSMRKRGILSQDRIEKLSAIGFKW